MARLDLYEPVHGSAPDIAGRGIANPFGAIASAAMLLRYTGTLEQEADDIEEAIRVVLKAGYRTPDIAGRAVSMSRRLLKLASMVCEAVAEIADMRHAYHAV